MGGFIPRLILGMLIIFFHRENLTTEKPQAGRAETPMTLRYGNRST